MSELLAPGAAGGQFFRQSGCRDLQEKLYTTLDAPTWHEVFACYDCAMNSLTPTIESYEQGLRQAEHDGMLGATPERINAAISDFAWSYIPPTQPGLDDYANLYGGQGYIEGFSYGGSVGIGAQAGREIVYNFVTFQRATFTYSGHGISLPGAGLSVYAGHVEGFVEDKNGADSFATFYSQYGDGGMVTANPLGAGLGFGAGGVHFWSADGVYPGLFGNVFYLSISSALKPFVDAGQWWLWYWQAGDEKSYIDANCQVKLNELEQDIMTGNASPFAPRAGDLPNLSDGRRVAVRNARVWATVYNLRHGGDNCSCQP